MYLHHHNWITDSNADCEAKLNFLKLYIQELYDGELNFGFCVATIIPDFQKGEVCVLKYLSDTVVCLLQNV